MLIVRSRPSLLTDLTLVIDTNLKTRYSSPNVDPRVTLMLRRSIKVVDETIQELTKKKMLAGVKTMIDVCPNLHRHEVSVKTSLGTGS